MANKQSQPKDITRVTIRFRDEVVAEEFHRQAADAGMRPSPFAAELIERALAQGDVDDYQEVVLHREIQELRQSVEALQELPQEIAQNHTDNDDVLSELAALRNQVAELKEVQSKASQPFDQNPDILRKLEQLRHELAELTALPQMLLTIREDVATGIRPLLVRSCGLSHTEAENWIRENILEE